MGDSDDSYDFSQPRPVRREAARGQRPRHGQPLQGRRSSPARCRSCTRYLGNPVLSFIGRLFFKSAIGDFHCGLRGFRRDLVTAPRPADHGDGVRLGDGRQGDAVRAQASPRSRPRSRPTAGRGPPHLRTWRDGWRHLRFLLIYSPRWLFIYPGIAPRRARPRLRRSRSCTAPNRIGSAHLDTNTLLYAGTAVVIGFQALVFGVLTRVYGMVSRVSAAASRRSRSSPSKARSRRASSSGMLLFLVGHRGSGLGGVALEGRALRPARLSAISCAS